MMKERFSNARTYTASKFSSLRDWMAKNPIRGLVATLLIIFILIVIGTQIRKPAVEQVVAPTPKHVEIYAIGNVPHIRTQAKVEKSGVIDLVAQTAGIVQKIPFSQGKKVYAGSSIVILSSNYQGGNTAALSRQLASRQKQQVDETYDANKELVAKQKELAEKSKDNANELREIAIKSLDDTRSLISLNDTILSSIDTNLTNLQNSNVNGSNDSLILSTQQIKSQYQSGQNQLRSALRQTEYQADDKKPAHELADLSRDVTIKQLEIQEKALDMNRDIAAIQLKIAQTQEAMMYPASPFSGTIQRIYVRVGQSVNPGTILATIAGSSTSVTLVADISSDSLERINPTEESILHTSHADIRLQTPYIPTESTNGSSRPVTFSLPDEYVSTVQDNQFLSLDIPLIVNGDASTGIKTSTMYVPLDSVFQSQDASTVFTLKGEVAKSTPVTLGHVYGDMVEITEGLSPHDIVILTRTVVDGEKVIVSQK